MSVTIKAALFGLLACGTLGSATAQFGFPMQMPENDFVWTWGRSTGLESRRSREDFSVIGNEAGFRCELTGRMSLARGSDPTQMRELENQLQTSLFFIQESARLMYQFDVHREIDWAMLDCKKPESDETEADLRDREDRARERAERARERRRARDDE
ncbi:MAG TPA: hypothetical protein VKQ06_03720 [Gammaproteobacteria bacterium]|nr:hypothetical protein [Gammaproteobacteria bacterium]